MSELVERRKSTCDAPIDDPTVPPCPRSLALASAAVDKAVQRAVTESVQAVFAKLGVNVNDPVSVEHFREDLRFGRRLRKVAEHGTMALVGAIVMAVVAALASFLSKGGR